MANVITVCNRCLLAAARAPFQSPDKTVDHVVNTVFSLCVECAAACMHRILRALHAGEGGGRVVRRLLAM